MTVLADYADKYETVSVQREDGILQVTFHSGDGSLLWGEAAHRELGYAFADIGADPDNKVVILTGTGDDYCANFEPNRPTRRMPKDWDKTYWEGKRLLINLLEIEVPERCQYIRTIMSEISRITDNMTCLGMAAAEAGAISVGFYMMETRELLYDLVSAVTGARLTVSYARVGGVTQDVPHGFAERVRSTFGDIDKILSDCDQLLSKNRIFIERMSGVGAISQQDAVSYSLTGPLLRATGIPHDIRRSQPYLVYDRLDFDIPTGTQGDNYDRFAVRFEELRQSKRMVEQALEQLPEGPVRVDDPRISLPDKRDVYGNIEGLMNHFKLVIEGVKIPPGEVYIPVEGANGELGFYLVSDGSGRPYRVRVRPPCFFGMAALGTMLKGHLVSDIITTFGMVNMIGGECDR